jgi:uncharacterized protein (TIGR00251 family)
VFADLYDVSGDDVLLRVHVQPGAGRNAVVGRHGDALKLKVGAPPAGGRANAAVVTMLAKAFGIPEAQVTVEGGGASRSKRIRLAGISGADVERLLELAVAGNEKGGPGVSRQAH